MFQGTARGRRANGTAYALNGRWKWHLQAPARSPGTPAGDQKSNPPCPSAPRGADSLSRHILRTFPEPRPATMYKNVIGHIRLFSSRVCGCLVLNDFSDFHEMLCDICGVVARFSVLILPKFMRSCYILGAVVCRRVVGFVILVISESLLHFWVGMRGRWVRRWMIFMRYCDMCGRWFSVLYGVFQFLQIFAALGMTIQSIQMFLFRFWCLGHGCFFVCHLL